MPIIGAGFAYSDSAAKMDRLAPSITQEVHVRTWGNDSTGTGSPDKPFLTSNAAMGAISDATQNKPYAIILGPGRFIETGDVLLKPYVSIIGAGQRATYYRINSGALKPHSSLATSTSWNLLRGLYFGGSSTITWDLNAIGGSNSTFVLEDVTLTGNHTFKGRTGGGGDFIEYWGNGVQIGNITLDGMFFNIQGFTVTGALTAQNTISRSGLAGSIYNSSLDGGLSINALDQLDLVNVGFPGSASITTVGTLALNSYRGIPPAARRTLSVGTTLTQSDT